MWRIIALVFALLALNPDHAAAVDLVTPVRPLPVYDQPPTAFQSRGAVITTVQPNERCEVLQRRTSQVLLRTEIWMRVRIARTPPVLGWIFAGREGSADQNVRPLP